MYIIYPLIYSGLTWILALPTLCTLCFLETGLSMVFPVLTHWWLRLISVIYIFRIFLLTRKFPYGKEIPNFSEIFSRLFILAVYFGAVFLLY
ncbi:MAG: hypothetical protein MUF15_18455, partial [Acidobacteria bacterium]|nr:hypothetical protein [Acidobacteriota bacterium]